MMPTMKRVALDYVEHGFRVFPCDGDTPLTQRGVKDATNDPDEVKKMWSKYPDANIAIATGKVSNIIVVNIKNHSFIKILNTMTGIEVLDQYQDVPHRVELPNGDIQLYLGYPPNETIQSKDICPKKRVHSDGDFVLAPPSSVLGGRRYKWIH